MGELARQPDAPNFGSTPLELLTPREGENYSWMDKNFRPLFMGFCGIAFVALYNFANNRPVYAGVHRYFLVGLPFYWIGRKWLDFELEAASERDAVYKHYISLHPEKFPSHERQRIKDLFVPWTPIR